MAYSVFSQKKKRDTDEALSALDLNKVSRPIDVKEPGSQSRYISPITLAILALTCRASPDPTIDLALYGSAARGATTWNLTWGHSGSWIREGLLGGDHVSRSRAHAFAKKGGAPNQALTSTRLRDE